MCGEVPPPARLLTSGGCRCRVGIVIKQVRQLTAPYDLCMLECDGLTRVLHSVLVENRIPHETMVGTVRLGKKAFDPHFWIRLPDGYVVDYRARMWLGDKASHGVFRPGKTRYDGKPVELGLLPKFLFDVLTAGC